MKTRILTASVLAAFAGAIILAACGGGSSSGSVMTSKSMGASGVITGFGSVIVSGREYATSASTQVLDGDNDDAASSTANLQVGMTVDVDAEQSGTGSTATSLRFTSAVKGEVDAVDPTNSTLTVLGQTVHATSGTSFAGSKPSGSTTTAITQLSNISMGDYVVVYGYIECPTSACSAGTTDIVATLINEPATAGKYRVQGYVSNYSMSTNSFDINGLKVDIATSGSSPTVCNTMNCMFANGDFVSVRATAAPTGTFSAGTLALTATDVKRRAQAPTFAMGTTVTLEGPITQLSATGFVIRGISVDASGLASSLAALPSNQIVEATGTISSTGTLVATAITVERHATFLLMGALDAAPTMTLSILGQTFSVTSDTHFVDRAQDVRPFNSTNFATVLKAGDQVVVGAYPSSGGNVATRVERFPTPSSPTAAVGGIVTADSASANTFD